MTRSLFISMQYRSLPPVRAAPAAVPSTALATMVRAMASAKLLLGGAGAALGVRVARSLYGRWRLLRR